MSEQIRHSKFSVVILSFCLALAMTGASLIVTMAALAGQTLAENKSLATLPIALQFSATMLTTIPASLLMGKVGRKTGFSIGQILGFSGTCLAAYAIWIGNFWLFSVSSILIGCHNAFWQYYRFAASETVEPEFKAKAISYVLAGGVLAAIAGPQLAKWSVDLFSPVLFVGGYLVISVLNIFTIALLQLIQIPRPNISKSPYLGRAIGAIIHEPKFIVAVISSMFGYGIMSLVMTATPLAMKFCGFNFSETATVIQLHALAMFAPSFFTGHLIKRFGVLRIILVGIVFNLCCLIINSLGVSFNNFLIGLVFLGLGWNFMFIGGTTLLTEVYSTTEKSRVQGMHDFIVFSAVTIFSFSAGFVQEFFGWFFINLLIFFPMMIAFGVLAWFGFYKDKVNDG